MEKKKNELNTEKKRYHVLDSFRALCLISMIAYHSMWDLVFIFGVKAPFMWKIEGYIWQQSICWSFILLSGFCFSLGRKPLKRGLVVFAGGLIITLVTCLFMYEDRVIFGVLTLIGSSMILLSFIKKPMSKVPDVVGIIISFLMFILFKNVNSGVLSLGSHDLIELPDFLYHGYLATYFGFIDPHFFSTDYFSILPWFFLFLTGFYLYQLFERKEWLKIFEPKTIGAAEWIGKHSLIIYMVHQPLVFGLFSLIFRAW